MHSYRKTNACSCLSSLPHNRTLVTLLFWGFGVILSLAVWSSVISNWLLNSFCVSFTCVSLLSFASVLFLFSFSLLMSSIFVALLSSHILIFNLLVVSLLLCTTLLCLLFSPLFPSLLPLFRLCKVQLGFGAFDLQAWRQEDALSEYALLGSLCVTLYFFALFFYPSSVLILWIFFFSYIRQVTVLLSFCGISSLMEEDPLPLIACRNPLNPKKLFFN